MKQTINQSFSAQEVLEPAISLAELFAGKTLANSDAPAIPAIEIVHYDHADKRSSWDVIPLSAFAIH